MRQYAIVDWELVRSTPLKHAYRCSWKDLLRIRRNTPSAARSMRRHLSLEWDGRNHLTVRAGQLLASKKSWKLDDVQGIVFGIREHEVPYDKMSAAAGGWLWFIHLNGRAQAANPQHHVLAELLVAHQHEAPSTSRARVPHRVKELLSWLEQCTGHRVHGPVLVTDETSRRKILSHVD